MPNIQYTQKQNNVKQCDRNSTHNFISQVGHKSCLHQSLVFMIFYVHVIVSFYVRILCEYNIIYVLAVTMSVTISLCTVYSFAKFRLLIHTLHTF